MLIYLTGLIFSYLLSIKLGMSSLAQPIRLVLTLLILVEALTFLSNIKATKLPSLRFGFLLIYIFCVVLVFPMNLYFNVGSVVKYVSYYCVFLAAYNGLNVPMHKLFSIRFLVILYAVSFWQIYFGDTEYINMTERVSGVYYKHSSGMALLLTILFGYIAYSSRISWRFAHMIIIGYLLVKTGSRSGLIAVLLSAVFIEVIYKRNWKSFILLFIIGYWSSFYLLDIMKSFSAFDRIVFLMERGSDASTNARVVYFNRAVEGMPVTLFGNGLGSFADMYDALYGKRLGAHNNILLFLIELGFFGLFLYVCHLMILFFRILKGRSAFLLFTFLAFYIGGGLNNNFYYPAVMIIFFLELGKSTANEEINSTQLV